MHFPQNSQKKLSDLELDMLSFWKENGVFQKSIDQRPEDNEYVFYDGPPFATGTPHYGHILAGAIKDAIPRYFTQKGFRVNRKFGWDCHGVPVEFLIEKEHKIGGKPGIEKMGVAKFNDLCESAVMRCADEWESTVERMGRAVDFQNDYKTMDADYMECVWSVFRELWNKGLIYEGEKVVPYSPKLGSPLSNFEANQNYQSIKDKTLTVKFELEDEPNTYFLAWTTTPWTLPSNLALCVNPEIEYFKIEFKEDNSKYSIKKGDKIIVAKEIYRLGKKGLLSDFFGIVEVGLDEAGPISPNVIEMFKGKDLEGLKYKPMFPYFADHKNAFRVLAGEFVSADSGTGIVHMAPNFGEDDAAVCIKNGIKFLEQPIDENGYFTEITPEFKGMYFRPDAEVEGSKEKNANDEVIKILKESGTIFKQDQYDHDYPFCWRTDCALMYRGIKTWFVDVQKIKKTMVEQNQNINWSPDHLKDGRFGNLLESAPDWAISRNRYWGAPLPVWRCQNEECGYIEVVSTRKELEEKTGEKVDDIHKQFVDGLSWECEKCIKSPLDKGDLGDLKSTEKNPPSPLYQGGVMKRIEEVLDCWFESGSMPYASRGVHFQRSQISADASSDMTEVRQADFIAEGLDQTRGWFYTLHVLGCALTGENIFKNVITNGIVLAEDGQKMSKSKKNYPDPNIIFDKYGADAMRFYMLASPVVRAENFRFAEKGVEEVLKKVLLPLHNVYSFFSVYANIDNYTPQQNINLNPKTDLDKWILSEYETLRSEFTEKFEEYKLDEALRGVPEFMDSLTNWFVRRSRDRFWQNGMNEEKQSGYETLYFVLTNLCKLLAPIMPFYTEHLWKNLTDSSFSLLDKGDLGDLKSTEQNPPSPLSQGGVNSIHLQSLATAIPEFINTELSEEIGLLRNIISLSAGIRARQKIKNRQPLAKLSFAVNGYKKLSEESLSILQEETNVKNIERLYNLTGIATQIVKPNARIIGKRFGKKTQEIIKAGKSGSFTMYEEDMHGSIGLKEGEVFVSGEILTPDEFEFGFETAEGIEGDGNAQAVVLLDAEITEDLMLEGVSRELIRNIQELRKSSEFQISDRICVKWCTESEMLKKTYEMFGEEIDGATLTTQRSETQDFASLQEMEIDGEKMWIGVGVQ